MFLFSLLHLGSYFLYFNRVTRVIIEAAYLYLNIHKYIYIYYVFLTVSLNSWVVLIHFRIVRTLSSKGSSEN